MHSAVFAEISYRLVQSGSERTVCAWYAAHRIALLSLLSVPPGERRAGKRFSFFSDEKSPAANVCIGRAGAVLNGSAISECVSAAAAHVAFIFFATRRAVRVRMVCADAERGEEFFVALEETFRVSQGVVVKYLRTAEFSVLVGRYRRKSGHIFKALESVECLVLDDSREADAKLTAVGELKNLQTLRVANKHIFSMRPIRALQNLVDVDASGATINNSDVIVFSQLSRLRRLILDRCDGLTNIAPLAGHASLETLSSARCVHLRVIGALYTVFTLRFVNLSFTNVPPAEVRRFLRKVVALVELSLDGLRLPDVENEFTANENLFRLSMNGMRTVKFRWVGALAPFLQELFLDGTDITERQLDDVSRLLSFLEKISLVGCMSLRTSFSWALLLENLSHVMISRHSVADDNMIEIISMRNVDLQIVG